MDQKSQLENVSNLRKDAKVVIQNIVIRKAKLIAKEKKWVDIYPTIAQFKFSKACFILYRRIQHDYPLKYIGNIDETPIAFNLP
ncbi:hypothetical protein C1646_749977 [Rhizophagus diaphanus]|nr:hypothetical protein C1646_749977 [Rhizophagus diaphanus] [Rhizophagus sp. MUCL 43196]